MGIIFVWGIYVCSICSIVAIKLKCLSIKYFTIYTLLQTNKKCYYIATIIVFCYIFATFCYMFATMKKAANSLIINDAHFATNATSSFSFQKNCFTHKKRQPPLDDRPTYDDDCAFFKMVRLHWNFMYHWMEVPLAFVAVCLLPFVLPPL